MANPGLDIDWTAAQILAQAIGVRPAARQMGIKETTMRQRSAREGWMTKCKKAIESAISLLPKTLQKVPVTNVTNAADAHAEFMRTSGKLTRSAGAKLAQRTLEHLAKAPIEEAMEKMPAAVGATKIASVVHGWSAGQGGSPPIRLDVLARAATGEVAISIGTGGGDGMMDEMDE